MAGAQVVGPCLTVEQCLRACRAESIDAAVLDVDLAGRDVFPVADILRERHVPIVFHTAHADRLEIAARFGQVPIFRKPADVDELLAGVARIIDPPASN